MFTMVKKSLQIDSDLTEIGRYRIFDSML